jgi:hypothetical protein
MNNIYLKMNDKKEKLFRHIRFEARRQKAEPFVPFQYRNE